MPGVQSHIGKNREHDALHMNAENMFIKLVIPITIIIIIKNPIINKLNVK